MFKKEKVDEFSFDCERIVSSDNFPNDTFAYVIVAVEKYLDPSRTCSNYE